MTDLAQPLVGRDRELEVIGQLLREACAGSPRFAFITGEPGIGKTRLLLELLDRAEGRGVLALRGRASEFERAVPFGLLVDACDEYLESLDPREFGRLATDDLRELAAVFPALRSSDAEPGEPTTAAERFRAHRAVRELIERLAARHPVLLVLDDLHWADGASLELASYLLRHPPRAAVMVAATFRTGQADRQLAAAIDRATTEGRAVESLALGPLTPADAKSLIDAVGATDHERFYDASGGNPLYLIELARMTRGGPGVSVAAGPDDVPDAIAAAIVGELDALAPQPRRLAEAAAVAGDPFDLDLALATAGMVASDDAVAALDDLVAHDLVRAEDVPRRFHFRHPLVRRAVYESCPPGARLVAHRRTADALAARGEPPAARAHHAERSARRGDLTAIALLREAGRAAATRAPSSAARWFAAALDLLPASAPAAERVELLTAVAQSKAATGQFEDSRTALVEGIALTADDDDARMRLISACAAFEQLLGRHDLARARLTTALAQMPSDGAPEAAALMVQLAVGDFYRMDYDAMRDWGDRALAVARRLPDPRLAAAAAAVLAVAAAFTGAIPAAREHAAESAALLDAIADDELGPHLDALANLATAELYLHRYDDAGAHARRGLAIARATGQGEMAPVLVPVLSHVLHATGRVAESAALLDGAVDAARLSGNVQALGWNLLSRAFTAVTAGDQPTALAAANESVDITSELDDTLVSTYASVALATALCDSGDAGGAIEVLLGGAGGEELPLVAGGWRANYFELLTRCHLAVGQPAAADSAAARAAATARELGLPLAAAMAHRAAAAVALDRGEPEIAAERALAAAAGAEEVGARVDAARARTLAGRALGRTHERARAVRELERAVRQLDACGAVRYRQEAEQELRKLGQHVHRRTRPGTLHGNGVEKLTERESEIARFVVDRRTNLEIATALFLSVKTIETHLRSIFRKLDVSSRHDVARAIERADRDVRQ